MKKHVVFNVSDPPFLMVISKYYNDIYYISISIPIYHGSWLGVDIIFIYQISFHYIPFWNYFISLIMYGKDTLNDVNCLMRDLRDLLS